MKNYKVSVVKCEAYDNKKVRRALLQSLKNLDFHFQKNKKILIKPNLLCPATPEQAITTHPVVLKELCKILKEYNSEIIIGDSPSYGSDLIFEKSNIKKLSDFSRIIDFEKEPLKRISIDQRNIALPKILFDVDIVINFAKMKTHGFTKVTLCTKNLYGCIPGKLKSYLHRVYPDPKKLSQFIIDLNSKIPVSLNLIDGILALEGNGPGVAGTPIKAGIIIASKNQFAADIVASKIMGFNPEKILTNKISGIKDRNIEVIGTNSAKQISYAFKKPNSPLIPVFTFLNKILPKSRIAFDKQLCQKCKICEQHCPVNVISLETKDKFPECEHRDCITCLCCIEVCPHNAVFLDDHWIRKSGKWVVNKIKFNRTKI